MRTFTSVTFVSLTALAVLACSDDGHDHDHTDAAVDAIAVDAGPLPVTLTFAARVNGAPFACGQTYANVGAANSDYVAADFRFFVHDVALTPRGGGTPVPVTLAVNDHQTADGIALLDFEDGTADCQMGSTATYRALVGTVPPGEYRGLSFKLGVPFAKNHLDPAGAGAPYSDPGLSWAWQFGYKFVKADGVVGGEGFNLHVGSTGCPGADFEQPPTGPCVNPNLATIELTSFDPTVDTVVADVGAVLAGEDLTVNTADTAPGCMSFPGDPECDTIFAKLGLPFETVPPAAQTFFHVE